MQLIVSQLTFELCEYDQINLPRDNLGADHNGSMAHFLQYNLHLWSILDFFMDLDSPCYQFLRRESDADKPNEIQNSKNMLNV